MKVVVLVCLFLAVYIQQTGAKLQVDLHVKEKVWSSVQTLLMCYYDIAFIYTDHFINTFLGKLLQDTDEITVAKCAVEIGTVIVTRFPDHQGICFNSRYVLIAERLLTCSGTTHKFLEISENLVRNVDSQTNTPDNLAEKIDGFEALKTEYDFEVDNRADDSDDYDKEWNYEGNNGEIEEDIYDHEENRARDFLQGQMKSRMDDAVPYPLEIFLEYETSESDRDKKKRTESSRCSFLDILEGAGRGFLGGGVGGYMGGGKLKGVLGAGVGTVVGGVAGCVYGGYEGGIIGGTVGGAVAGGEVIKGVKAALKWGLVGGAGGGAVGGYIEGWPGALKGGVIGGAASGAVGAIKGGGLGAFKGGSVGGAVAGIRWGEVINTLERAANWAVKANTG